MADAPYTGLVYEPDGDDSSVSSSGIGRLDAADPGVEFPAEIAWLTEGRTEDAAIWATTYRDPA